MIMKNISILLIFTFFSFCLSAQRSDKSEYKQHFFSTDVLPHGQFSNVLPNKEVKPPKQPKMIGLTKSLKNTNEVTQRLDSIVYRRYDTVAIKWNRSSSEVFIYDSATRNILRYQEFELDTATKSMKLVYKEEYSYNPLGDRTEYIEKTEMDGVLVNSYRETYTYDEMGRPKSYTEYNWDKNKSKWVENYKEEYTYDIFL